MHFAVRLSSALNRLAGLWGVVCLITLALIGFTPTGHITVMLITELIKREINDTYKVKLTDLEVDRLRHLLDDFATFPGICCADLYAELRDEVSRIMEVSHPEAYTIAGCLESEDDLGDLHRKFTAIRRPSRSDPCWRS